MNCEYWNHVICQDTSAVTPAADVTMTHNGKSYTLMPSKSGNFEEVKAICEAKDMMIFEPRNKEDYDAVYEKARENGMDMIYMNIQRENPDAKYEFIISMLSNYRQFLVHFGQFSINWSKYWVNFSKFFDWSILS